MSSGEGEPTAAEQPDRLLNALNRSSPLIGAACAVLLYATIRGRLVMDGSGPLSLYGLVALPGAAGLLTRAAMQRRGAILGSLSPPQQPGHYSAAARQPDV